VEMNSVNRAGSGYGNAQATTYSKAAEASDCSPARSSQVEEWLIRLENSVDGACKAGATLSGRLTSVLTPEAAEKDGGCAPDVCLVPLADQLRSIVRRIDGLTSHLHDVHSRLELT
jgi:hypothetical protein